MAKAEVPFPKGMRPASSPPAPKPVPPLAGRISVPLQTPVVIVPKVIKDVAPTQVVEATSSPTSIVLMSNMLSIEEVETF